MDVKMGNTGILTGKNIVELGIIEQYGADCIKSASCDLRLGKDVFICGQGKPSTIDISENNKEITLKPFIYVMNIYICYDK